LLVSCHDCSEGGLAVALAEMCIAGRLGALLDFQPFTDDYGRIVSDGPESEDGLSFNSFVFSESLSRFIIEVPLTSDNELLKLIPERVSVTCLGQVTDEPVFRVIRTSEWIHSIDV